MNNENDEEKIKILFTDKILKSKKSENYLATKIFEEYVKCKNAVNIYLQSNQAQNKSIPNKKHQKNIYKYTNIKYWIKMIIKPEDNENNILMSKKSYSYANIKSSEQVPKPLGDINFPMLYYYKNIKNEKNSSIYSTTSNIFNYTIIEPKNDNDIFYNDEKIINKLKEYYNNFPQDFIHSMQNGLPNSFRLISWNIINNINIYSNDINFVINNNIYNANNLYKKFLLKFLDKAKSDLIYRDIKRTYPLQNYDSINKTKKDNDEKSLYNILKAFWNIDEEIGYCQGMNYISGFLLLITDFDEKSAFFLLISIFSETFIKRSKYNFSLRGLFIEEFPLLYFYIFIFDDLLNKHLPKLKKHLIEYDIPNDVWIIKWFQTAFTILLPINWTKKLWDNIFCSDFFFIIKFSISLCFFLSKDILGLNDTQLIMDYFRNIQKVPMNCTNEFLENKFDINNLLEKAKKINIDIKTYFEKYKNYNEKGKKFYENIHKINNIKYFEININTNNNSNYNIKKTNTTVKESTKAKIKHNNILPNINLNSNGSNKLLKFPKHSFASKSNSSDINNIKLNSNKRLCAKYKLMKKKENINKVDYNKKLIIKNKLSNSNIRNSNNNSINLNINNININNNIITEIKSKNNSPKINSLKIKELLINTSTEPKKEKLIIHTKQFNNNINNNSNININSESMNTMVNKNHYQKILYKRKKNMGNIPKRNGFSSSNIKQMQKKNSSNKTNEISEILNSSKKNISKENSDIKVKSTIMKNKLASISILNTNKNNFENNSRNNLINELKRRKQYLNKQIKYFLTNDSAELSNSSFFNSDKKKIIGSNSNSKNNIKENEKNNGNKKINHQIHKDTKPTKYIKISI